MTNKSPKVNYSFPYGEKYNQQYFSDLEKADKLELPRNLRLLKLIEKYQHSGNFLDIGVGSGLMLKLSQKNGFKTYGVDVSEYAISRLKKIIKAKLFCGDLKDLNLPNNFFEAVNMRHSIEHLKNPQKTLKLVFKLLKPGGVVCVATPNSFGLHAKIFGKDWPHLSLPYHLHFFSQSSLKNLLTSVGFEILEQKTEELTNYDLLKLLLFKLGIKSGKSPTKISFFINQILAKLNLGEGLVIIAKKPV